MQESRCPECNAPIGGSRHRLNSSNTRATEFEAIARRQGSLDGVFDWTRDVFPLKQAAEHSSNTAHILLFLSSRVSNACVGASMKLFQLGLAILLLFSRC